MNLHARYSRSHCLTNMPNDAVARLKTRLANQSELTRIAVSGGDHTGMVLESAALGPEGGAKVALKYPGPTRYPLVFAAISRNSPIASALSALLESGGWRLWYDSMRNAVRTAENKPACEIRIVKQNLYDDIVLTYKHE